MKTTLKERTPATLTIIENAFELGRIERTVWDNPVPGAMVSETLPAKVTADGSWVCIENGRTLAPETWATHLVTPGTELICYPRIGGTVGKMIAGGVLIALGVGLSVFGFPEFGIPMVLMGIGLLAGGALDLIMGPPKMSSVPSLSNGDQNTSPTYGFGGVQVSR